MKKINFHAAFTLLLGLFTLTSVFGQAPQKMTFQAVIRDVSNNLVTNSTIGIRVSILQGSPSGTLVYQETQSPVSNVNGLVTIEIGSGSVVSGTFSTIDWSSSSYYLKTEVDPGGGTSYNVTGTSQLLSVPYALYAERSGEKKTGFAAYASNLQTITSQGYISFDSEEYDESNSFAADEYTAPESGLYHFNAHVRISSGTPAGSYIWIGFRVNGGLKIARTGQSSANTYGIDISSDLKLNAGDRVKVYLLVTNSSQIQSGNLSTWFNGHKVY